jgi:hypothetical protein
MLWQQAKRGEQDLDETKSADRGLKEAAAQLSSSITKVSTLPKNVHKAIDTADT